MQLFTAEEDCQAISNLVGFGYSVKFSHLNVASFARKKQSVAYTEYRARLTNLHDKNTKYAVIRRDLLFTMERCIILSACPVSLSVLPSAVSFPASVVAWVSFSFLLVSSIRYRAGKPSALRRPYLCFNWAAPRVNWTRPSPVAGFHYLSSVTHWIAGYLTSDF